MDLDLSVSHPGLASPKSKTIRLIKSFSDDLVWKRQSGTAWYFLCCSLPVTAADPTSGAEMDWWASLTVFFILWNAILAVLAGAILDDAGR